MSHVGGHGHGRAVCLRVHRKGGKGRGFGEQRAETPPKPSPGALMEADKRWKLDAYDRAEWEAWLQDQKQSAGVKGNNLYLQVCPQWCIDLTARPASYSAAVVHVDIVCTQLVADQQSRAREDAGSNGKLACMG